MEEETRGGRFLEHFPYSINRHVDSCSFQWHISFFLSLCIFLILIRITWNLTFFFYFHSVSFDFIRHVCWNFTPLLCLSLIVIIKKKGQSTIIRHSSILILIFDSFLALIMCRLLCQWTNNKSINFSNLFRFRSFRNTSNFNMK